MQIHLLVHSLAYLLRNRTKLVGYVSVISSELKGHEHSLDAYLFKKESLAVEDVVFTNNSQAPTNKFLSAQYLQLCHWRVCYRSVDGTRGTTAIAKSFLFT